MKITLFKSPLGEKGVIEIEGIYKEDEEFFVKHNIELSAEESKAVGFVVYGDYSNAVDVFDDENGEFEAIVFAYKRSAKDTFKELRNEIERILKDYRSGNC